MKSSESRQLKLVFADNSREIGDEPKADVSAGRSFLKLQANVNLTNETDARMGSDGVISTENLLEVPGGMARKAVYQIRGCWKRSASFGVHKAYPNAWFAERLVDLQRRWHELHPLRVSKQLLLFGDD